MKKVFILSTAAIFFAHIVTAQTKVPLDEVSKHVGETVTVCDKIYGGKFLENSKSKPTLLDMGGAVPNNKLTIVINVDDRKNFTGKPEEFYAGKNVCLTGKVIDFKGKPEIIVSKPEELQLQSGGGEIRANDFMRFE